ncbi:MAG TPA: hypothetical protein VFJ15_15140 [Oleiagrimonas sp.]|nr:hypothetical protein [Oleiagrimonas sp.]
MANQTDPPKQGAGDVAHAAIKAGLSAIPVLGGTAAELFQLAIQPPLECRRTKWMAAVGEKLRELEEQGVILEELAENEEFVSAVMQASSIALRTHQQEKLDALRNAVLNTAMGEAPDEALQHMFFHWVDSFSALHLRILKVFQVPQPQSGHVTGSLRVVLEASIPELRNQRHIYDQIWKELYASGLVNTDGLHAMMTGMGLTEKRTSQLGDAFLQFINDPTSGDAR